MSDLHIRFSRLEQVCSKALEESQKVLTDENLQACYPSIASTQQGRLLIQTIKQQLEESWSNNTHNEFSSIFQERQIEQKLNELDDLIALAQQRKDSGVEPQVPIDQLPPASIVSSHLIPMKEDKLAKLQQQLDVLRHKNVELYTELQQHAQTSNTLRSETVELIQRVKKMEQVSKDARLDIEILSLASNLDQQ